MSLSTLLFQWPCNGFANIERAQMLIECQSRKALQQFLSLWHPQVHDLRAEHRQIIRWAIDVDPLAI
jgi:primosomal protein N' (replication factor Y)